MALIDRKRPPVRARETPQRGYVREVREVVSRGAQTTGGSTLVSRSAKKRRAGRTANGYQRYLCISLGLIRVRPAMRSAATVPRIPRDSTAKAIRASGKGERSYNQMYGAEISERGTTRPVERRA